MNSSPTPRLAAVLLAVLAAAATGCSPSDSCESSAICAAGELCFEGRCVAQLPPGSCTPPDAGTIGSSSVSTPQPTTCPTPPSPVGTSLPVGSLLPLKVDGADAGTTATATVGSAITFDVPPGTSSVTILQQSTPASYTPTFGYYGYAIPNSVVPTAVRAPNGGRVYDDAFAGVLRDMLGSDPSLRTASYLGLTPHTGAFTLPATARLLDLALSGGALPAGTWSFQVNDWNAECGQDATCDPALSSGSYQIDVVARPGPYVSTGTLNLGIYLAGGTLTAAQAAADAGHQRFVWGIAQVLGRAGLCLGTVTFFDMPAWVKTTGLDTPSIDGDPPCGDLSRLFSTASPAVRGAHLFLVDDLVSGQVSGIIGIDGSIPGPSGLPGAVTSGAAMIMGNIGAGTCIDGRFDLSSCGSDYAAYVAAHEIGHWLGLYHTTERYGNQFDPLEDTATCGCSECAGAYAGGCSSYSTLMDPAFCAGGATCGGADNLMFWVVDRSRSVGLLTTQQGLVMRVNPAVQ